ncbi:uncharacterized protein LOC102808190 [Saccoglossus kowalevskii]
MSQLFNLKDNGQEILAVFLGHYIRVHRKFYRIPQDTLQIAKVSRILLACERGSVEKYKNKSLDDIEIDLNEVSDDEESVLIDIKTPEAPTEKTADLAVCKIEPYLILESSFRNLKNGNELSDDIVNSAVYPATQKREFSMSLLILKEGHLAKVMLFSLRLHLL